MTNGISTSAKSIIAAALIAPRAGVGSGGGAMLTPVVVAGPARYKTCDG
jgi:hypothetical protein